MNLRPEHSQSAHADRLQARKRQADIADGKISLEIGGFTREELMLRGVKVVYRDEYDDLCEVAQDMAAALRPFAKTSDLNCTCPEEGHDSCQWCEARHALRAYDEAER